MRAAATPWFVAAVAAALVGGGRVPGQSVLADGPAPPSQVGSVIEPPVTLAPGYQVAASNDLRAAASVSGPEAVPSAVSAQSIPAPALAAYQRAAVVIDTADLSCHLDWPLLAAIGQVESDHGQVGGSHLNSRGVAHPPIIGPRLDGTHGTSVVRDTDAGRLDGDKRYDHAVGPMQFLPSTWAVVAVDGNDDGTRNVEDVNDAALGSAVYLCAGHGDLSTAAGAKAALLRYNHSQAYAAMVMGLARALRLGSVFTSVATTPTAVQVLSLPHLPPAGPAGPGSGTQTSQGTTGHPSAGTGPTGGPTTAPPAGPTTAPPTGSTTGPTDSPTTGPTDSPSSEPTDGPTGSPTTGPTTGPTDSPSSEPTESPTSDPTGSPTSGPSDSPSPTDPPIIPDPVPDALAALTAAQIQAIDDGWLHCVGTLDESWTEDQMQACLADQLDVPQDDAVLLTFLQWAVDQGLMAGREESAGSP